MKCSKFRRIRKEIRKLTFRTLESEEHKSLWDDFEKVLLVRTFMLATARSLLWIVTAIFVAERYDRYDKFVEKNGGPFNK